MGQDYWWVTRPKRKLNSVPEELAAFCSVALEKKWFGNRSLHIALEEELERTGTKRIGERRDASGSGGRTHAIMLYSLGLWFEKNDKVFLTLAGESIISGKSAVSVLTKQVLRFQYPSPYSEKVKISPRFRVRPFIFLLRLLLDPRVGSLTQDEIAYVVTINAENETERCFEDVVGKLMRYRNFSAQWRVFGKDYLSQHHASEVNLMAVSNTIMNWLDYTQLVYREGSVICVSPDKISDVKQIVDGGMSFIKYPDGDDIFQRKYGVDPWHQKDTRNILQTGAVSVKTIERNRILRVFFNYSSLKPVRIIDAGVVNYVSQESGVDVKFTEDVLQRTYPNGALGGYLSNYRSMAFKGRDEAVDFEKATANLFQDVFGYKTIHLGQTGAKSAPDVLVISDLEGYQAIIDNKAYSKYSISGDHHNRMVHNYIEGIGNYSKCSFPIGYFAYISGGFTEHIDSQILKEVKESGVHGSCITVSNLIAMIETHVKTPYSHKKLRDLFGVDRQILLSDINP
ncbi:MAG: restriction endonuclease [Opitutae bacterium]|nr:restriction endonuclease [Opitutae bacterium]MCD8298808.1 restriction endonuclease [Opitutae bacterium]